MSLGSTPWPSRSIRGPEPGQPPSHQLPGVGSSTAVPIPPDTTQFAQPNSSRPRSPGPMFLKPKVFGCWAMDSKKVLR
ncbi:hypothetical protein V6N13_043181 [Hibiscus sabdariffa]